MGEPMRQPVLLLLLGILQISGSLVVRAAALTVVEGDGVRLVNGTAEYHFAPVEACDAGTITAEFQLRNDAGVPQTLAGVEAECGCTKPVLLMDAKPVAEAQPTLPAGAVVTVRAVLDLAQQKPGAINKHLWVTLRGEKEPAATLALVGELRTNVVFLPEMLKFDREAVHLDAQPLPKSLLVVIDQRLAPEGRLPELCSSNDSLIVRPVSLPVPRQAVHLPAWMRGRPVITRAYSVAIAKTASIGPLFGELHFAVPLTGAPREWAPLANVGISIAGEIIGEISADPSMALFDMMKKGTRAERRVTLRGQMPTGMSKLTVATSHPWLLARFVPHPSTANRTAGLGEVIITITEQAPAGPQFGSVTLTLASGRRLTLQVLALIE